MARSSNMVVPEQLYDDQLMAQVEIVDVFNRASRGAIVLENDPARRAMKGGDYYKNVQFKRPADLVTRKDTANPANTKTAVAIQQAAGSSVVLQQSVGPATFTDDERFSGFKTPEQYTRELAQLFAEEKVARIRNLVLSAATAAIDAADTTDGSTASANIHILDVARGQTAGAKVKCTMSYLNQLLNKMADNREKIVCFVMPSMVFADLVGDSISNYKIENVAGAAFVQDVIQAFGRAVLIADVPCLTTELTSSYYTEYGVLGLGAGAVTGTIVREAPVETERDIKLEVPKDYVRQDFDLDVRVQGMKWEPSSATPNPTDAQLATAANWEENYTDHRQVPIVKGIFNGAGGA